MAKWLVIIMLLPAAISAADFHLWLKCTAVELYLNATGANFTLPQCEALLNQVSISASIKPMVGVGELKILNVTDPRSVFNQLREVRQRAIRDLGKHLNKTVGGVYKWINASKNAAEVLDAIDRGLGVLARLRGVLVLANATGTQYVDEHIKWLNLTKRLLSPPNVTDIWYKLIRGNMSDADIDKALDEAERLREQVRQLWEHFEKVKISGLPRQLIAKRLAYLNITITTLRDLKAVGPEVRSEVVREIIRGNIDRARQIARSSKRG